MRRGDTETIGVPILCQAAPIGADMRRVLILPWGMVCTTKGDFLLDQKSFDQIQLQMLNQGVDLPIDKEHETAGKEYVAPDGSALAYGWIKRLEAVPGEGIYALIDWTRKGAEWVTERAYRYLSPAIDVDPADKRINRIFSVALTNRPAIRGAKPILNREGGNVAARSMRVPIAAAAILMG